MAAGSMQKRRHLWTYGCAPRGDAAPTDSQSLEIRILRCGSAPRCLLAIHGHYMRVAAVGKARLESRGPWPLRARQASAIAELA